MFWWDRQNHTSFNFFLFFYLLTGFDFFVNYIFDSKLENTIFLCQIVFQWGKTFWVLLPTNFRTLVWQSVGTDSAVPSVAAPLVACHSPEFWCRCGGQGTQENGWGCAAGGAGSALLWGPWGSLADWSLELQQSHNRLFFHPGYWLSTQDLLFLKQMMNLNDLHNTHFVFLSRKDF